MRIPFLVAVAIAGLGVPLCLGQSSEPFSLDTPITVTDLASRHPELSATDLEKMVTPLETWRAKAAERVHLLPEAADSASDFGVLVNGVRYQLGTALLADEYLAELPDSRLAAMMREAPSDRWRTFEAALARRKVAEAILARPSMAPRHAEAALERARVVFVTTTNFREIQQAFEDVSRYGGADVAEVGKAAATVAAIHDPQEPEDFAQGVELLDIATQYGARVQGTWVADGFLRKVGREGISIVAPASFGGNDAPLKAVARAAFEMGKTTVLVDVLNTAAASTSLSLETRVEVNYWAGMNYHAGGAYDRAIPLFEENLRSGSSSYLVACSCFRLAQTYMLMRDYVKAGVQFYVCEQDYSQYPGVASEGRRGLDFLIRSNSLRESDLQAAHKEYKTHRELAMGSPRPSKGGR